MKKSVWGSKKFLKYLHKKYYKKYGKRKLRRKFKNISKIYFKQMDKKTQFHENYLI